MAAFLSAMQVFNDIAPPYTATVLVELLNHTDINDNEDAGAEDRLSVRVWYKNSTSSSSSNDDDIYPLTVPGKYTMHHGYMLVRALR